MTGNKERQAKFRQDRKDAGLEQLRIWLHPEDKIKVKQLADKLNQKRGIK
jgi:hypothetical protein